MFNYADPLELVHYIDADGGWTWLNDGEKYVIGIGESGRFSNKYGITADTIYGLNGDVLRSILAISDQIELPITVIGDTESEFLQNMRDLRRVTNPLRGSGKLRYEMVDGTIRHLNCHLSEMDVVETEDRGGGRNWRSFSLIFTTHDPFWYDPLEIEKVAWGADLDFSQLYFNGGDQDTQPIWTLRGPMTDCQVFNEMTNKYFYMDYTLVDGEYIYIDTRQGSWNALLNHATNVEGDLSSGSEDFPLIPGANKINIQMTGADGNSIVSCRYVYRFGGV
jgi:hypothetical protein